MADFPNRVIVGPPIPYVPRAGVWQPWKCRGMERLSPVPVLPLPEINCLKYAIELTNLRKTFGDKVAVTGLNLTIKQGSVVAFLGPNGAGKTTTIRMILSILFADSGKISVLGRPSAIESKDRIGYLPEERGLYRRMKVGSFLAYMAKLKGVPDGDAARRVAHWLERVGLADCHRKKCEELSKGMQQKVGFITAVIHEPELIILDEPFSGLDPVNARLLRELIDEQHASGRTIIFSTHVMSHAEALCDHVVMINRGEKVLDEPMQRIRSRFDPRLILLEPLGSDDGALMTDSVGEAISRLAFVERVDRSKLGTPEFSITLREGSDTRSAMVELLGVVPTRRLELKRVRLEDVFIRLVGEHGGAGGEDGTELSPAAAFKSGSDEK